MLFLLCFHCVQLPKKEERMQMLEIGNEGS
jgi:hypothetical protein